MTETQAQEDKLVLLNKKLLKAEEQDKVIQKRKRELQKQLFDEKQKRKIKYHDFLDEELFTKIVKLESQTVIVKITNDQNNLEDVEMTVTKKVLVKAVQRIIQSSFDEFEFLDKDFK